MKKTNTLIFLSIALNQTKAGPQSSGTPFLVFIMFDNHQEINPKYYITLQHNNVRYNRLIKYEYL